MGSITLVILGFAAGIIGLLYYYKRTKSATGSAVIVTVGLLCLYILALISDMILAGLGYPSGGTHGYFFQALIYLMFGSVAIGIYHFLMKEARIGYALQWTGTVLLISGGIDMIWDLYARTALEEIKLTAAVVMLGILLFLANRYKDRLFSE